MGKFYLGFTITTRSYLQVTNPRILTRFQGSIILFIDPWKWDVKVVSKRRLEFTTALYVITQESAVLIDNNTECS